MQNNLRHTTTRETECEEEKIIITDHVNTNVTDRADSGDYTVFNTCV